MSIRMLMDVLHITSIHFNFHHSSKYFQLYFPEIMPFLKRYSRAALRGQDEKFIETCQVTYFVSLSLFLSFSFFLCLPYSLSAEEVFQVHTQGPAHGTGRKAHWDLPGFCLCLSFFASFSAFVSVSLSAFVFVFFTFLFPLKRYTYSRVAQDGTGREVH